MKRVEVYMTPAVMRSPVSGKTYIIAGKWIEVPDGTTLADVDKYVVRVRPRSMEQEQSWQVPGSQGNVYTIRRRGDELSCSCPGWGWRRNCKHVAAVAA